MHPRDKIGKSSWTLFETAKDAIATNITTAVRSGQLKVEADQIERLLAIINASADEGYHRGFKAFMKGVDAGLDEAARDAEVEASMPSLKASAKKK
jgi:hypothetical protein